MKIENRVITELDINQPILEVPAEVIKIAPEIEGLNQADNSPAGQAIHKAVEFALKPALINIGKSELAPFINKREFARAESFTCKKAVKAEDAVICAKPLFKPLLNTAENVLLMIEGGLEMTSDDIEKAAKTVLEGLENYRFVDFCARIDEDLNNKIRLTLLTVEKQ